MKQFAITVIRLLCMINSYGQKAVPNKIISNADSIFIVSHLLTYESLVVDENGKTRKQRFLIKNGFLNKSIIKEYVKLSKPEVDTLLAILNIPETASELNAIKCFSPHHGIVIFKNKMVSYIDICFDCLHIAVSNDIDDGFYFSTGTWKKLRTFFKSKKIHYQMNNDSALDHLHLNAK